MKSQTVSSKGTRTSGLTRRRVLTISGAALGLSALPFAAKATPTGGQIVSWNGIALGAVAQMQVVHTDRREGEHILEGAVAELRRLEGIFSIYDETSDLSRLNNRGLLNSPPPELVEVLSTSLSLARISGGAFDPSTQVLWERSTQPPIRQAPLQSVLEQVDYHKIAVSAGQIRLEQRDMALSLNGIAQGYITDRIVSYLQEAGLGDALIDCGEIYAAGRHPSRRNWQVAPADNSAGPFSFQNQAVATSSGSTPMTGGQNSKAHIFDPATGKPTSKYQNLTVIAPSAILADGLSTTLSVLPEEEWADLSKELQGSSIGIYGKRNNGTSFSVKIA